MIFINMHKNTLKRHLIKIRGYMCESCTHSTWMGKPIPLELHHIDGNRHNNTEENGKLLCPNCHTFTPNFKGKNIKTRQTSAAKDEEIKIVIPRCQSIKEVITVVGLSSSIVNYDRVRNIIKAHGISLLKREPSIVEIEKHLQDRRVRRPSKIELEKMVWEIPTAKLAKMLGVSDSAIGKWCKYYGINKPKRGYWASKLMVAEVGVEPTMFTS